MYSERLLYVQFTFCVCWVTLKLKKENSYNFWFFHFHFFWSLIFDFAFFCKLAETVARRCSVRKGVLRNFVKFTAKHLCQSLFFNKFTGQACNFIKKETLAQVFSCEFSEISKNNFSYRTPLAASQLVKNKSLVAHELSLFT